MHLFAIKRKKCITFAAAILQTTEKTDFSLPIRLSGGGSF
jgi:hypothetical protein